MQPGGSDGAWKLHLNQAISILAGSVESVAKPLERWAICDHCHQLWPLPAYVSSSLFTPIHTVFEETWKDAPPETIEAWILLSYQINVTGFCELSVHLIGEQERDI